jgi:hypothetical protein
MRIGGVSSANNTADILTKTLQPPLHAKHVPHCTSSTPHSLPTHCTTWPSLLRRQNHQPKQTKQQKRRAKKQRKRERDNKLIALAQNTLRQHHQHSQITNNGWLLLEQMHKDRDIFPRTHNPGPPNLIPPQRRTRHLQCPTCLSQPPNRTNPANKKRHTPTKDTHNPEFCTTSHSHEQEQKNDNTNYKEEGGENDFDLHKTRKDKNSKM